MESPPLPRLFQEVAGVPVANLDLYYAQIEENNAGRAADMPQPDSAEPGAVAVRLIVRTTTNADSANHCKTATKEMGATRCTVFRAIFPGLRLTLPSSSALERYLETFAPSIEQIEAGVTDTAISARAVGKSLSSTIRDAERRHARQVADRTQTPTSLNGNTIWGLDRIDQRVVDGSSPLDSSCAQA